MAPSSAVLPSPGDKSGGFGQRALRLVLWCRLVLVIDVLINTQIMLNADERRGESSA